jgi:hypothetical protein
MEPPLADCGAPIWHIEVRADPYCTKCVQYDFVVRARLQFCSGRSSRRAFKERKIFENAMLGCVTPDPRCPEKPPRLHSKPLPDPGPVASTTK